MATPSSSATSPSPPLAYLSHNPVLSSTRHGPLTSSQAISDNEQRQRAVKKFLARAEVSMVTRALRTRLSYASYKATHNVPHASLQELETNPYSSSSLPRSTATKRKAPMPYHSTLPSAQGSSVTPSTGRRAGSTNMPPPASSPRSHHPSINGASVLGDSRERNPGHSLYSSLLAPMTVQQARTIHNAMDPPIPAAARPMPSPRTRSPKHNSRRSVDGSRPSKSRKVDASPSSPAKRRTKRVSEKTKHRKRTSKDMDIDTEEEKDVDMKAAATLTSLLLHNRSSIASTSSPRSSIDGSEPGSLHPNISQVGTSKPTIPVHPLGSSVSSDMATRVQTPPPLRHTPDHGEGSSTPRPAPTDNEAANLMLFLATSPSPARPTNKDSRDSAAFRALSGGTSALRDKGRVLFASNEPSASSELSKHLSNRDADASYNSSISSISTIEQTNLSRTDSGHLTLTPSQLLPPPTLPSRSTNSRSPPSHRATSGSPRPPSALTPVDFNFSDFIHASPSPLRGSTAPVPKANLGLRADIGRKLFEEEQMRQSLSSHAPTRRHEDPGLAAGIDLLQT